MAILKENVCGEAQKSDNGRWMKDEGNHKLSGMTVSLEQVKTS